MTSIKDLQWTSNKKQFKLNFAVWQELECIRLGIGVEDHNKLIEIADMMTKGMPTNFEDNYNYLRKAVSVYSKE